MRKLVLLSATALLLVSCATSDNNGYKGTYTAPALNISNDSGSFIGSKVNDYVKEYNSIRSRVSDNAESLAKIQEQIFENDVEYNSIIATMEDRLSTGTTPSNPDMVASLEKAQKNIVFLEESTQKLTQISYSAVAEKEKLEALKSAVNASYGLPGAYDVDHTDLNAILSAVDRQTASTADLIAVAKSDISSQQKKAEEFRKQITRLNVDVAAGYLTAKNGSSIATRTIQPTTVTTEAVKNAAAASQIKLAKKVTITSDEPAKKKVATEAKKAETEKKLEEKAKKVEKETTAKAEAAAAKVEKKAQEAAQKVEAVAEKAETEVKVVTNPQIIVEESANISVKEAKTEKVVEKKVEEVKAKLPAGNIFAVDFTETDDVVYYDSMAAAVRKALKDDAGSKLEVLALMPMDTAQQDRAQNLSAQIFGQLLDLQVPPENLQVNSRSEINRKYPSIVILKK